MVLQFPPWRHDSELAMIRDWFFPDHAKHDVFSAPIQDMRQRAIDKVNLWLFKAGQLPAAIVATAGLTEALLHDDQERPARGISDSAMQSIYAMAFARFVNGFVDRDVARSHAAEMALKEDGSEVEEEVLPSKGENSMYAHAVTIGLPQKFVDLRHQVAHGNMPNVYYMRQMTLQALAWLWERWWVKSVTGDPSKALREVEERRRISREAAEREVTTHSNLYGYGPKSMDGLCREALQEETSEAVSRSDQEGRPQRPGTAQKRKARVLEEAF
ncbi:Las1-like-domain-containing protein [Exophiala viscosa]|uniref:Las1-like-domain-containing protein n=1 Tax=Exophiala viscosa TaxID=2486360 RepID=A0AAN6DSU8_9EURO|nr:Las1-like-domain-containing protein [Exophiala viscosa]KAI1624741.1 Las1-like-domain-containing protein [Exophiala viscosa]